MGNPKRFEVLCERGKHYLNIGEIGKAEEMFREAAKSDPTPVSVNNLATCRLFKGDPKGALRALEGNLKWELPNPYGHALAAQALAKLDRKAEAEAELEEAIRDFEAGLNHAVPAGLVDPFSWREYTVIIKRTAGALGDHRRVLELYNKWEKLHTIAEDQFLAGVAAFNLGDYKLAMSHWRSLPRPEWGIIELYLRTTELVDRGIVPPFPLEYDSPVFYISKKHGGTGEGTQKLARQGWARMITLGMVLAKDDGKGPAAPDDHQIGILIRFGGEWGVNLAKQLQRAPSIPEGVKAIALMALVELGIYKEGEPIDTVVGGETRQVVIKRSSLADGPIPELDDAVDEAIRLRKEGKLDEAITGLASAMSHHEDLYPPAMMTLANLFRLKGRLDEAENLLLMLAELFPNSGPVLLNLASLYLQRKDPKRARLYVDRIDPEAEGEEFRKNVQLLKEQIQLLDLTMVNPDSLTAGLAESYRKQQEDKHISLDLELPQALRRLPVSWLDAACSSHGLDPKGYNTRDKRAKALASLLINRDGLARAVRDLESDEKELIRIVLENGGWVKISRLTRDFGSMEGDGFWWGEEPPKSTLGRLWSKALVFVGRSTIDGRRYKVAVIPAELRAELQRMLLS